MNRKYIGLGIFLASVLTISTISIILLQPKQESNHIAINEYIATDDMGYIIYADDRPDITYNLEYVNLGCLNYTYNKALFRFNLTEKPDIWENCYIRLYISQITICGSKEPIWQYSLKLNYNIWNELMSFTEFMDTSSSSNWEKIVVGNYSIEQGFLHFNITNHVESYNSITLTLDNVYPDWFNYSCYYYHTVFTKDSNVDKEYLPQLMWS